MLELGTVTGAAPRKRGALSAAEIAAVVVAVLLLLGLML